MKKSIKKLISVIAATVTVGTMLVVVEAILVIKVQVEILH